MHADTTTHARPVAVGTSARDAGEQYLALQLASVAALCGQVGQSRLARRMVAADLMRGRTASAARIGEAIADATSAGADPVEVMAIGERIASWFRALVSATVPTVLDAWDDQSRSGHCVSLCLRRAVHSNDPHTVARAVHATSLHLVAGRQLLDALMARHAQLTRCA